MKARTRRGDVDVRGLSGDDGMVVQAYQGDVFGKPIRFVALADLGDALADAIASVVYALDDRS